MSLRDSLLCSLAAGALLCGCSTAPAGSTRAVTGQVDTTAYSLDNAKVVAQASDGRRFLSPLDARGTFQISLPVGPSYRLAIANTLADGTTERSHRSAGPSPERAHTPSASSPARPRASASSVRAAPAAGS